MSRSTLRPESAEPLPPDTTMQAVVPAPRRTARLDDPRSVRSREALRQALLRLIETRRIDAIPLKDITVEAGVSYPTFFNHYDGRQDLFQDIARGAITDLLAAFRDGRARADWRPGIGVCRSVMTRRALWQTLLTAGARDAMRTEFIRLGRELSGDRPNLGHDFPVDVVSGIIYSGIFEIIAWWLAQEQDPGAPAVADMLETLVIEPALNLPAGYFTDKDTPRD